MKKNAKTHIAFGRHPVVEAIRAGSAFDKILLQRGTTGDFEKEIRQLCRQHGIPLQYVPREKLNRIVKGNHQGVVGYLALIRYYQLEDVVPHIYEKGETPLLLLLDGVTDVRNLGAIARSAEVSGAHALVVPWSGSALINADALKTSAGALSRLVVCREKSLVSAVEYLQNAGIRVFASDLTAPRPIGEMDFTSPSAIVVGSEDEGVSEGLLRRADERFIIPQKGTTDSYNVSVAAGIMLYEAGRQRKERRD
ncbi:MAG TPA: 23S rRNA (guanosine(2251)-2'-O)-methyltransferase RlmB [Bacteroidetes bacterium]|nr:23S rRNA (guanosine(2251)-2'-O)-methyltransferase RlmB [Bacteroidota bacterium]